MAILLNCIRIKLGVKNSRNIITNLLIYIRLIGLNNIIFLLTI